MNWKFVLCLSGVSAIIFCILGLHFYSSYILQKYSNCLDCRISRSEIEGFQFFVLTGFVGMGLCAVSIVGMAYDMITEKRSPV